MRPASPSASKPFSVPARSESTWRCCAAFRSIPPPNVSPRVLPKACARPCSRYSRPSPIAIPSRRITSARRSGTRWWSRRSSSAAALRPIQGLDGATQRRSGQDAHRLCSRALGGGALRLARALALRRSLRARRATYADLAKVLQEAATSRRRLRPSHLRECSVAVGSRRATKRAGSLRPKSGRATSPGMKSPRPLKPQRIRRGTPMPYHRPARAHDLAHDRRLRGDGDGRRGRRHRACVLDRPGAHQRRQLSGLSLAYPGLRALPRRPIRRAPLLLHRLELQGGEQRGARRGGDGDAAWIRHQGGRRRHRRDRLRRADARSRTSISALSSTLPESSTCR